MRTYDTYKDSAVRNTEKILGRRHSVTAKYPGTMSNDKISIKYRTQCVRNLMSMNYPDITILQTRLQNLHWSHIKIWKSRFPKAQEELGRETEKQKQLFMLQHQDENN